MNKTTFQIYGLKKIKYYGFLPSSSSYILGQVNKSTYGYFYGSFTGYTETGIVTTKNHLIKLNSNLTIDNSFDIGTGFDQILYAGSSILEQPDGKLIVTGTFTTYRGLTAGRIVRLNSDGSNDNTMGYFGGGVNYTQLPTLQSDGKIIVTGGFSHYYDTYGDHSGFGLARLNVNGTYDDTFSIGSGFNQPTMSAVSNDDLSMIITGYFNTYKGVSCSGGIIKLDQYGNKDNSFISGTGFNNYYLQPNYAVKVPGESSFYVTGYFTSYNGVTANHIVKIKQDGSIDNSFNSGLGFNGSAYIIQVIWGNKLFITNGDFTSYNGILANKSIVLNADGTILWSSPTNYNNVIVIGDTLFGQDTTTGHLIGLFNYIH